jgi:hypothetical protein
VVGQDRGVPGEVVQLGEFCLLAGGGGGRVGGDRVGEELASGLVLLGLV